MALVLRSLVITGEDVEVGVEFQFSPVSIAWISKRYVYPSLFPAGGEGGDEGPAGAGELVLKLHVPTRRVLACLIPLPRRVVVAGEDLHARLGVYCAVARLHLPLDGGVPVIPA